MQRPELWPGQNGPAIDYISAPPSKKYCESACHSVVILGSTGSIGRTTLSVINECPDRFKIDGLACARNVEQLAKQALFWRPAVLGVLDETARTRLLPLLPGDYSPEIVTGSHGYARMASRESADLVVSAQVGAAGLPGTLAAALAGKTIALANKESLVLAGALLRRICGESGASILPLDSEHYAIFECIAGRGQNVKSIILTASGGPFLGLDASALEKVTPERALKHPNWDMGAKITIDSATLMNKGLEVIEAMHLYGLNPGQVDVLVHPQSVVHSFARLADNSLLAQLAVPSMRLPVANCLLWPRHEQAFVPELDMTAIGQLNFSRPDIINFPCLELAREAMATPLPKEWNETGLNPWCTILNAANEEAVAMFLRGQCGFRDIPALIAHAMKTVSVLKPVWDDQRAEQEVAERAVRICQLIAGLDATSRQAVMACSGQVPGGPNPF